MNSAQRHPRLWLAQFCVSVPVLIYGLAMAWPAAGMNTSSLLALANQLALVLALVPLFGYVRQRRIGPRALWRALLILSGLGALGGGALLSFYLFQHPTEPLTLVAMALFLVVCLPLPFALFQYVHRSPQLWQANSH